MKFKYKINLEIDVDFDAPLLGTDTTKGKRSRTDMIAKVALAEMIKLKTTSYVGLDRVINEDNLQGTIKGSIMLRSHKMLDEDNKNGTIGSKPKTQTDYQNEHANPDVDFMYNWIRKKSGKQK